MRRRHRRKNNQRKIIIFSLIGLLFIMAVGYSAFQTNLNINVKGNIKGYTVTFNANGGIVDVESKRVKCGSNYGDLPTPTREGYTFKGWHGKNMLNVSNKEGNQNGLYYVVENETIHINGQNTQKTAAYGLMGYSTLYKELEQNKTYTFSIFGMYNSNIYSQINYVPNASSDTSTVTGQAAIASVSYQREIVSFTTPADYSKFAQIFIGVFKTAETVDETFKLQLEEGNEPTTKWEPYFITSETEVVQEKNHTLTAIWEENS